MNELHKISCMHDTAIRTEISGSILDNTTCKKNLRKISRRHTNPRIGLGILQKNIVTRLELLDKIVLQQQGISLRLNDSILSIGNLRDHHRSLAGQALRRNKILRDPLMEIFCLTHINNIPLGVIISIDAWGMWKQFYLIPDIHGDNCSILFHTCEES